MGRIPHQMSAVTINWAIRGLPGTVDKAPPASFSFTSRPPNQASRITPPAIAASHPCMPLPTTTSLAILTRAESCISARKRWAVTGSHALCCVDPKPRNFPWPKKIPRTS
ncbi:hypothetical protein E2C01_000425 [Portunus trituberculatus]|uniref:Uncharacterized protein n=1 Tax=Portunus trituberculatus TaxID=210409 RepID=A0A5B7CF35_PORTR|nr:hypothetical protein [Portunus trituberculatus]